MGERRRGGEGERVTLGRWGEVGEWEWKGVGGRERGDNADNANTDNQHGSI